MLTLALRIARKDFGAKLKKEIYISNSIHRVYNFPKIRQ